VFVQIGLVPNTDWLKGTLELNRHGEIVVDARGQTSVPGVFAAGDVTTVPFKQIVIALGEGARPRWAAFEHLIRRAARADRRPAPAAHCLRQLRPASGAAGRPGPLAGT
jgi:alkyl hydroperoxide reductase subunit F